MTVNFAKQCEQAERAARQAAARGQEYVSVAARQETTFGVRIANGAICRENVWSEEHSYHAAVTHAARSGSFHTNATPSTDLGSRLETLTQQISQQGADSEYVAPLPPIGSFRYQQNDAEFADVYAPERIYGAIASAAERVRERGLRLTGYVEARAAQEQTHVHHAAGSLAVATKDHGLTASLTVDDPASGAVSTRLRTVVRGQGTDLTKILEEAALASAMACERARDPIEIPAGDYTVILEPSAVHSLLETILFHGLLDRQKIDEGRTWLSQRGLDLNFPESMHLTHSLELALPDPSGLGAAGTYVDLPYNHRFVHCRAPHLITQGRLRDLYLTPFWAKQRGEAEGFLPYASPPLSLVFGADAPDDFHTPNLDALISSTERGLLVTSFWYLRMVSEMEGIQTGMTRDGVFLIENGQLTRPVLNMRWHENLLDALTRVSGATANHLLNGRTRLLGGRLSSLPTLRVERFHFSSVTKF